MATSGVICVVIPPFTTREEGNLLAVCLAASKFKSAAFRPSVIFNFYSSLKYFLFLFDLRWQT
jgi:hypothetical protein